jgi:hypothetical protein
VRRHIRFVVVGFTLAMLGAALALMPGCTRYHGYELRGVVRNAADGSPVPGVKVDVSGPDGPGRSGFPATTDPDGAFAGGFSASGGRPLKPGEWTVKLTRDGFADEVVDITPVRVPDSAESRTQLFLVVYVRPKSP